MGLDLGIFALTTAVVSLLGIFAAQRMVKLNGVEDPRWIVIDETAGMLVSLTPLLLGLPIKPISLLAAFILFRIFDILKPFPVGWADRKIHGGLGIVLDDLFAGVYSAVILYFCRGLL
ncbi:MAG: Phosphatidylglycerophosphatase A [Candidatus Aminicenantes bacterium ADurb.Bin508]|nr:MAG: Phosphatidylglycerophosphatase A [Candidatus Aminicenantes bacterium ADurb.Bin508]